MVTYQPDYYANNQWVRPNDQFFHRYIYDAENRLIYVETSTDKMLWERDARYYYYKHGPLARVNLGELQVQGVDYAYTLQGWLKGVNSTSVNEGMLDIGQDGKINPTTSPNGNVARDVYGFSLNYFSGDYKPVGGSSLNTFATGTFNLTNSNSNNVAAELFNGNIAAMAVNIPKLGSSNVYGYKYDQLNRIVSMDAFTGLHNVTNTFTAAASANYKERVTYDANGNILTYLRNGDAARPAMDNMTYSYKTNTNQLDKAVDVAADVTVNYERYNDIKQNQQNGNYQYDAIGNLISDVSEGITNITWNVYGKIESITKASGTISYTYDASGNRISKTANNKTTWYVRDASGNVMGVYTKENTAHLFLSELHLYGSSRLGILNTNIDMQAAISGNTILTRGNKFFELSNHLGNVLVTISDKKLQHSTDGTTVDYYTADVISAQDYAPFGALLPGRKYSSSSSKYRYGYNGKENDNEVKGEGNQQDYGMRIYDPRLGRFLSVDPIAKSYPELTPYQFASNSPIALIDIDGLEGGLPTRATTTPRLGPPSSVRINSAYRPTNPNSYRTRSSYQRQEGSRYFPPNQYNQGSPKRTPSNIYEEPDPLNRHEGVIGPFIQKNSQYKDLISTVNALGNAWDNRVEVTKVLIGYTSGIETERINAPAQGIITSDRITSVTFDNPVAQQLFDNLQARWKSELNSINTKNQPIPLNAPYSDPNCVPCVISPENATPAMKQQRLDSNKQKGMAKLIATIMLGPSPTEIISSEMEQNSKNFKVVKEEVKVMPEIRQSNN